MKFFALTAVQKITKNYSLFLVLQWGIVVVKVLVQMVRVLLHHIVVVVQVACAA
jgi:hypothetical protein